MSTNSATTSPFPHLPTCGITFPNTPLLTAALEYSKSHTSPSTVNHCLRSAAFSLLIASKIPPFKPVLEDKFTFETAVLSLLLHDLGWATTKSLLSKDKRFEVDGANLAKAFVHDHAKSANGHSGEPSTTQSSTWSPHRTSELWSAIALHTTPSIALHHPSPVVPITAMGILADFLGPNHPTGVITVPEFQEIVSAFPRLQFREELPQIMCGLCMDKPETTYDNFVGEFGLSMCGEEYRTQWKQHRTMGLLTAGLEACKQFE